MTYDVINELRISDMETLVVLHVSEQDHEYEVVLMDTSTRTPKKTYVQPFVTEAEAQVAFRKRALFNGAKARNI